MGLNHKFIGLNMFISFRTKFQDFWGSLESYQGFFNNKMGKLGNIPRKTACFASTAFSDNVLSAFICNMPGQDPTCTGVGNLAHPYNSGSGGGRNSNNNMWEAGNSCQKSSLWARFAANGKYETKTIVQSRCQLESVGMSGY